MKIFEIKQSLTENLQDFLEPGVFDFLKQNHQFDNSISKQVLTIIEQVKKYGDQALIELSNKFDLTNFKEPKDLLVSESEFELAKNILSPQLKEALELAKQRIENYHRHQLPQDFFYKDDHGVELGNRWQAIQNIGVYVPGGSASYPSSVLMSSVVAKVAKVKNITLCVPTTRGQINPVVLYACQISGVDKVFKIGGAQAITALACGTQLVCKVDKIVGPGNAYVAYAKKHLYGEVGIDMIAGPTDVLIVADCSANVDWLAVDALSQLEHGIDSKAIIIVNDYQLAKNILSKINKYKQELSRINIIEQSLNNSAIFVVNDLSTAPFLVNFIAPEHLQIVVENPQTILPKITNAGAIFLGNYTPEAIGDYIAGPSHTLPTAGNSRFASGLSVFDFLKRQSVICCSKDSFPKIANQASLIANCEGLTAHQLSLDIRSL